MFLDDVCPDWQRPTAYEQLASDWRVNAEIAWGGAGDDYKRAVWLEIRRRESELDFG